MELWDIYDKNRNITGKVMERGKPIADDDFHLVVHVCIFNSNDEMLIQQRQPFKEGWPNLWDLTVGGSAIKGDSSEVAIKRELFEELGYSMEFLNKRPHLTVNFDGGFDDIYLVEQDIDLSTLHLQEEEVKQVKWASKDEIIRMIDDDEFIPYYDGLIELFFNMRKGYGMIRSK